MRSAMVGTVDAWPKTPCALLGTVDFTVSSVLAGMGGRPEFVALPNVGVCEAPSTVWGSLAGMGGRPEFATLPNVVVCGAP